MRVSRSTARYLDGEAFTSNFVFDLRGIGHSPPGTVRLEYLRSLVRGKNVIDVGCVGHLPLIDSARKRGQWLHEIVRKSAAFCAGMDIDREGCAYLEQLGFDHIYCSDIVREELPRPLQDRHFDLVLLGETLEHVDDPVAFLNAVRHRFAGTADRLVLTTPNAFRLQNMVRAIRGHELINSDHRYWFSPYSLAKVLWRAGFREIDIRSIWAERPRRTMRGSVKNAAGRLFPAVRDVLIADARIDPEV